MDSLGKYDRDNNKPSANSGSGKLLDSSDGVAYDARMRSSVSLVIFNLIVCAGALAQPEINLTGLDPFPLPSGPSSDPNGTYVYKEDTVIPFPWNPSQGWTNSVWTNSSGWRAVQQAGNTQVIFHAPEDSGRGTQAFLAWSLDPSTWVAPYNTLRIVGGTFTNGWSPVSGVISSNAPGLSNSGSGSGLSSQVPDGFLENLEFESGTFRHEN